MKANRKIRENKKGVTPALTMLLVIPVILMLISAVTLWSENFLHRIKDTQDKFNELRDDINNLDFAAVINGSLLIYEDDFEDSKENNPQWETNIGKGGSDLIISPQSYYSGKKSGFLDLGNNNDNGHSGIKKTFSDKCYGKVSINLAFTIDENEKNKTISIYQDNSKNLGRIRIDTQNKILSCLTKGSYKDFANNVYLYADDYCWHTMELIVDFESNNLNYVNFTLDGITYNISGSGLEDNSSDISNNHKTISVEYICRKTDLGVLSGSYVDDFVFLNLEPFKKMGINIV